MFFSTRNSEVKRRNGQKNKKVSKEKFNELVKDSNREEVLSVVDASKRRYS